MHHLKYGPKECREAAMDGRLYRFSPEEIAEADEADRLQRRRLSQLGVSELACAAEWVWVPSMRVLQYCCADVLNSVA